MTLTSQRNRSCAIAGSAAALLVVSNMAAYAAPWDTVPLPRANPFVAASASQQVAQSNVLGGLFGRKRQDAAPPPTPSANSPFTPTQQVALTNISQRFNSFDTMEGEFIQVGPRGEQSEGVFVRTMTSWKTAFRTRTARSIRGVPSTLIRALLLPYRELLPPARINPVTEREALAD